MRLARLPLAALIVFCLSTPAMVQGAQDDQRLGMIFQRLKNAETNLHARPLEQQIWQIWTEREDTTSQRYMEAGAIAMSRRDYAGALANFDALVAHDPSFAEAWNKRATIYYLMGQFDNSVHDIERVLALEPRHFGALSGLGLIFMAVGNDEAAISSFEKALEINPHMLGPKHHIEVLKQRRTGSPT